MYPSSLTLPSSHHTSSTLHFFYFLSSLLFFFFFFNDTATTEIYTLSLHDALPISRPADRRMRNCTQWRNRRFRPPRSEEHTSELQSRRDLVCRLLLEKKKKKKKQRNKTQTKNNKRRIND